MTTKADREVIRAPLRRYILDNFLPGDPESALQDDDLLLESGIVDSASVIALVAFLEEEFQLEIPDEDLFAENFASVNCITRFLQRKHAGERRTAVDAHTAD